MTKRKEPTDEEKVASLIGRTIVKAEWEADPHPETDHWNNFESCTLTLDDGREVVFGAWGHDAWGATISVYTP